MAAGHETIHPNFEAMWNQHKTRFWKVYNDVGEETASFRNFSSNVETIHVTSDQAEQQHLTSSVGWRVSCTEIERKSTESTKIVDEILSGQRPELLLEKHSKDASVTDVGKAAPPDSGSQTECERHRDGEETNKRNQILS